MSDRDNQILFLKTNKRFSGIREHFLEIHKILMTNPFLWLCSPSTWRACEPTTKIQRGTIKKIEVHVKFIESSNREIGDI